MEDEKVDEKYKREFNDGYLLAQHHPHILKEIETRLDKDSPLLAGKRQYEADKARNYFKQFDRGESKDRDKNKDIKK